MSKRILSYMLGILWILVVGCSTSYHARGSGEEGYADRVVRNGPECKDPRPGNCNFVEFTASSKTDDEVLRVFWRKRVAEICGGPAGAGDQAIRQWIERNRIAIDRDGNPIDSASIMVEEATWTKDVLSTTSTRSDPRKQMDGIGPQSISISGKRVQGLIHCPTN